MPTVVGVSFRPVTKVYYFEAAGFQDLQAGDYVVVETSQGREVGQVVWSPKVVSDAEVGGGLKPVVRRATAIDLAERDQHRRDESRILEICRARAAQLGLPMKVVSAEYSFDGARLVVSFTSEGRIDFRELVRDLAKTLSTRIEMKQIGVRDEAKVLDGIGKCGRQLCCSGWLREFAPVTIKMAKNQNLPLNPPEISGVCGRLLCCLAYEMDVYTEARNRLPKVGATVETPDGKGRVRKVQPLSEVITVRLEDESMRDYPVTELQFATAQPKGPSCGCSGCAVRSRLSQRGGEKEESAAEVEPDSPEDEPFSSQAPGRRAGHRRRRRGER